MVNDVIVDVTYQHGETRLRLTKESQFKNLQKISRDPFEDVRIARMYRQLAEESDGMMRSLILSLLIYFCFFFTLACIAVFVSQNWAFVFIALLLLFFTAFFKTNAVEKQKEQK